MQDDSTGLDTIVEAVLLAAGEPLSLARLASLFDAPGCPSQDDFKRALEGLSRRHQQGALELVESVSGYQLRVRPHFSPWVSRLWDERPQRYSRALLETLALIAYRQPVTRGDIEEVRGVAVSTSIMRTLMERGWIRVVGHRDVPGKPAVYATTRGFLDDLGLRSLDSLPPMQELSAKQDGARLNALSEDPSAPDQSLDGGTKTMHDARPESAQADPHAGTASTRSLSFADLEARLAARAQQARPAPSRDKQADTSEEDHESEP